MKAFRIAALLALAPLLGCATQAAFDQRMGALVGLPEADLVRQLGVPNAVFVTEGRRFLQYDGLGQRAPAQVQPTFGFGIGGIGFSRGVGVGTGIGFGGPAYVYPPPTCSVTFEMAGDRVGSFTRRGDGCLAVPAS